MGLFQPSAVSYCGVWLSVVPCVCFLLLPCACVCVCSNIMLSSVYNSKKMFVQTVEEQIITSFLTPSSCSIIPTIRSLSPFCTGIPNEDRESWNLSGCAAGKRPIHWNVPTLHWWHLQPSFASGFYFLFLHISPIFGVYMEYCSPWLEYNIFRHRFHLENQHPLKSGTLNSTQTSCSTASQSLQKSHLLFTANEN